MTTLDRREQALGYKFGHDDELRFKAWGRKNKMLGLWAAGLMGKTGAAAATYACDIVMADFETPGDHHMVHILVHDLAAAGKPTDEHAIRRQDERFMIEVMTQVMAEVRK